MRHRNKALWSILAVLAILAITTPQSAQAAQPNRGLTVATVPPPTVPAPTVPPPTPTPTATPEHRGNLNITQVVIENNPGISGQPNQVKVGLRSQWGLPPAVDTAFRVALDGEPIYEWQFDTSVSISQTVEIPFLNPSTERMWHSILATTRRTDNWLGDTVLRTFQVITPPTPTPRRLLFLPLALKGN